MIDELTRRELLKALTSAAAMIAMPLGGCASESDPALRNELVRVPHSPNSWGEIGSIYIERRRLSAAKLSRLLTDGLEWQLGNEPLELELELRRRIQADFAAGRVALVDGWMLSTTEAQLAGLLALNGPHQPGMS